MTHESITVPGLADDENRTLNLLLEQLDKKMPRNSMRAQVYDGKRALRQISSVMPAQYNNLGLTLGWVAKGVDALARRCTLEDFTWAGGDLASLGGDTLFTDNAMRAEANSWITSSLIHATAFLVNVRGEEDEPDSLILARDAMNATGTWNPRRRGLNDFVSVTDRKDDKPIALVLYLDGVTISIDKYDGGWKVQDRSEHPWGVPVEVLPYRPRLGRAFGSSRMTRAALSAQFAGLREVIRLEGHMDVYSFPEMLILGADSSVFKDADGNTINSWMQMLGRIKALPDDQEANPGTERASVVPIPAASPEPHLANVNTQAKLCARELNLPDSALALTDFANPTSAEAYDASQYELVADAEGAIDDWTEPVTRSYLRGLAIKNNLSEIPEAWGSIRPKFRNPRYTSRAAEADAGSKQIAALPWLGETTVGLELVGLTPEQAKRAVAEKRRADGRRLLERVSGGTSGDAS